MIHKTKEGRFVISDEQSWRPGSFETEYAAQCGELLDDATLQRLQESVNGTDRDSITTAMLIPHLIGKVPQFLLEMCDDTPADEDFCKSLGINCKRHEVHGYLKVFPCDGEGCGFMIDPTRGQVRHLLAALRE